MHIYMYIHIHKYTCKYIYIYIYISRSFKTAIYGTFVRRMRKDVRYCFDKNHEERLESKLE